MANYYTILEASLFLEVGVKNVEIMVMFNSIPIHVINGTQYISKRDLNKMRKELGNAKKDKEGQF